MRVAFAIKASVAAGMALAGLTVSAAAAVGTIPPSPPDWMAQPLNALVAILAAAKAAAMAAALIGLAWLHPEGST